MNTIEVSLKKYGPLTRDELLASTRAPASEHWISSGRLDEELDRLLKTGAIEKRGDRYALRRYEETECSEAAEDSAAEPARAERDRRPIRDYTAAGRAAQTADDEAEASDVAEENAG